MGRVRVLIILLFFGSCGVDYTYKQISESYLDGYKLERLNQSSSIKFYSATKDLGPPENTQSFVVIEKSEKYYKVNPEYKCEILDDTTLILQQLHTTKVSSTGNWIYLKRSTINGHEETQFKYDSVPAINKDIILKELDEGIYFFKNQTLEKVGKLMDYTSMHQMKLTGLYYLTNPGVFYKKKIINSDLK